MDEEADGEAVAVGFVVLHGFVMGVGVESLGDSEDGLEEGVIPLGRESPDRGLQ